MSRFSKPVAVREQVGMTRKQVERVLDTIMIRIGEANGLDLTKTTKAIDPEVLVVNALTAVALNDLADQIVAKATAGNKVHLHEDVA